MILFSKCEGGRVYFAMAISVPLRRKRRPIAPHELKHDLSILFNLPSFKPAKKVLALAILSSFLLVSFVREVSREWLGKGGPRERLGSRGEERVKERERGAPEGLQSA